MLCAYPFGAYMIGYLVTVRFAAYKLKNQCAYIAECFHTDC